MMYAKIINNEVIKYPYTDSDLKFDNPNTSFSNIITDNIREQFFMIAIQTSDYPNFDDKNFKLVEEYPVLKDNMWVQNFSIILLTDEEKEKLYNDKVNEVKNYRNQELSKSDFTQLPDVSLINKDEWVTYRQLLRDVPEQEGFPFNIIWPTKPNISYS